MTHGQYLDVMDFSQRVGEDAELMIELYQLFLEDSSKLIVEIKTCAERNDARAIKILAHTLKGSSASVSAKAIHEIAWELEKIANEENLSAMNFLLGKLIKSYKLTVVEIEGALEQLAKKKLVKFDLPQYQ